MKPHASAFAVGLALAAAISPGMPGCNAGDSLLRAKVIERRDEVVGGPVAMADVGDFLLENDRMRVAILGARDSPGPGVFGGAVVDIDLRRTRMGFEGAQGHDRFAETFPLANLLVPDPTSADVRVLEDGSNGQEAAIRVEGRGQFLFEALSVLRSQQELLGLFFPDVRAEIAFRTDYVLHPGDQHITIRTTLLLPDTPPKGCPGIDACGEYCPTGNRQDDKGCLTCACSDVLPLENTTAPTSVFGGILGDATNDPMSPPVHRAGIVAGDFVFFGNQNDVFAPGPGFDEDAAVQDAYIAGRNTFQEPLTFDFVAAAGGDVSYGYFTVPPEGGAPVQVNVPLFASAATSFLAASKSCLFDASDDDDCDALRAFSYERYLAVGHGDIASVAEEMYRVRGTKTGGLGGHVYWQETGEPAKNAHVFVFSDPRPDSSKAWRSVDDLAEANRRARGDVGLLTAIDADPGLDLAEDGDFHADLPPGRYVVAARDEDGVTLSEPLKVDVRAGKESVVAPVLPTAGTLEFQVTDESGTLMPAKLALIALDESGKPREGDGLRKVYLGDDRLGNGKREIFFTASGAGEERIEPGRYRLVVSRGIEYGIHTEELELGPGEVRRVDAVLPHEVETSGWMSTDMHLHATPSFDSGMPLPRRVTTAAAEGVELAVSTDHDVESDYRPAIRDLLLEPQLATAIGAEITTLEQGHFVGFPLLYDALDVPRHGAHDWTCEAGGTILAAIRDSGDGSVEPLTIVAHPRDGFFGYIDQLGVDAYTLNRTPTLLEANNPVFRTAGCEFDAMEIINGKRFDLVRTPSVAEVADWNRCLARVNAAASIAELMDACPEAGAPLAPCTESERFAVCKGRHRTALAWRMMKRVLARTPEEQDANWSFAGTAPDSQALCDLDKLGDAPVPDGLRDQPCTYRSGQVDDFFRYLEHGLHPTQISSSDSHNGSREPGYPRTFFRSPTDAPSGISIVDAVESLRGGHALATYGPFVRASIAGKSFGDVVAAPAGSSVSLDLDVETASWFGVDRVEIYLNGRLVKLLEPKKAPSAIVDVQGKVTLEVPDRDAWVVVIAMGLEDQNLMSPVSLDIPYGEVQLSRIASDAFARIPAVSTFFKATPTVPDWSPTPPYAVSNPIYIDTDGNGRYDAPQPLPDFCSRPCDPAKGDEQCPEGQKCLDQEKVCGIAILGACDHRRVSSDAH